MVLSVSPLRAEGSDEISFNLVANPKFSTCLGNDSYNAPTAKVTVSRGTFEPSVTRFPARMRNS